MKRTWFLLWIALATPACGQDAARDVIVKAIKAHGGAEQILKLRKASVSYHFVGILPGMEHIGRVNIQAEETYDLPKIMKMLKGTIGGDPGELSWAIYSGKDYWIRENNGPIHYDTSKASPEDVFRPFLIIERLIDFLGDDVTLEKRADTAAVVAHKELHLVTVAVSSVKRELTGTLFFDQDSGLLAKTERPWHDGRDLEQHHSGYRSFDGLTLFTSQTSWHKGEKVAELAVRRVSCLTEVDETLFEPDSPSRQRVVNVPAPETSAEDRWYLLAGLGAVAAIVVVYVLIHRRHQR
jgi:hypothetical protein